MLDLQARVRLPDLPDVIIHRDDRATLGFYAWPATPRIALDATSRYDMRLLVYGKTDGGIFTATGALLSVTAALELTALQTQQVHAALSAWLSSSLPEGAAPVEAELLSAEWVDGDVELRLPPGRSLHGLPSLYAGNHTVFTLPLSGAEAGPFLEAWTNGLSDASLSYSLRVRAQPGPAIAAFTFHGPLMPHDAHPEDYVTRVSL